MLFICKYLIYDLLYFVLFCLAYQCSWSCKWHLLSGSMSIWVICNCVFKFYIIIHKTYICIYVLKNGPLLIKQYFPFFRATREPNNLPSLQKQIFISLFTFQTIFRKTLHVVVTCPFATFIVTFMTFVIICMQFNIILWHIFITYS